MGAEGARVGNTVTDGFAIQRGVRQGFMLSPLVFNLYFDQIFKALAESSHLGIKINVVPLTAIMYAEDTVISANNIEGLQDLLNNIQIIANDLY